MIDILKPWIETLAVLLLAVLGVTLGRWFSTLKRPYWVIGYFTPLFFFLIIGITRCFEALEFTPPFSWFMSGRTEFALIAIACTMLLTTPLSRFPHKTGKILIYIFMSCVVVYYAVLPFFLPGIMRGYFSRFETKLDPNGVCLQSNGHTCGPAAAVSVLNKLGLLAEEGELAILSYTSPIAGTPADSLCLALRRRYAKDGLKCEYRRFKSIAELQGVGPVIAVVKHSFLVDHYVAIFEATDTTITIGDPFRGMTEVSYDKFNEIWRYWGIVLQRSHGKKQQTPHAS